MTARRSPRRSATRSARASPGFVAAHGRPPGLDVVLVGEDPASVVYTRNKEKASNEVGMRGRLHRLPAETTEDELLGAHRASLNADDAVDGILVQLPLPKRIREERVLDAIDPRKDVDGFHPMNAGLLATGPRRRSSRARRAGCMRLLAEAGVDARGARARSSSGRSNIVGKPMAQLLLAAARDGDDRALAHARPRARSAARPTCSWRPSARRR